MVKFLLDDVRKAEGDHSTGVVMLYARLLHRCEAIIHQ